MKKLNMLTIVASFVMILSVHSFAADTHSAQAVKEGSKASSHASASAAHSIAASGQVTSAASAVPLAIGASIGAVSGKMAKNLMDAATAPIGTPLEITDESVTAGPPPDQALTQKKKRANTNGR